MFNFHIGIPGLFPELLHSVSDSDAVLAAEGLYVLSRDEYRTNLQELVIARGGEKQKSYETQRKAEAFINAVSVHDTIAASQPVLLGVPQDALRPRKALPLTEARVGRLSGLLDRCSLTIHLSITSQIDYLLMMRRMPEQDRIAAILSTNFSWAELVHRVRRGAPTRDVVVWDFERPKAVAPAFVEAILNIDASGLSERLLRAIGSSGNRKGHDKIDYAVPGLQDAVMRLDMQYEKDLEEIERIEGVTLIRPEMIPPELHL